MLPSEPKHTELEDILQELLARSDRPTARLLDEFVQKYPDFASDMLSFTSEWAVQELINESEVAHEIDEKLSQTKAHSALKNALFRFDRKITEAGREVETVVAKAEDSEPRPILTKVQESEIQRPTIFILGTDPLKCKELGNI